MSGAGSSVGRLRGELSGFVGRRSELALIRKALGSARLVTLCGPGGIGKTRLAVRAGWEARRAFGDGVWLVELAALGDPALLAAEVARAVGLLDAVRPDSFAVRSVRQEAGVFIDVHNHVIPDAVLRLGEQDRRLGISADGGVFRSPHHVPFPLAAAFHSPAEKLADLAARGLWGAVISPAPVLFGYDLAVDAAAALCEASNQGMAQFCAHAPDRLHWLANLPMQAPEQAARIYADAVAAGAVGAAMGTSIAGRRLDEPDYEVFWKQADAIALPVLIHPAFNCSHPALNPWYLQNAIGNPLETTIVVERLICAGVLARYTQLRLVLMHGGGFLPYQAGRLVHARSVRPELAGTPVNAWEFFDQLYFDTITHDTQALRYLVERVGLDHVVLGTDLPFDMALAQPVATLTDALTEAQIQAIAFTNPRRLFGLG